MEKENVQKTEVAAVAAPIEDNPLKWWVLVTVMVGTVLGRLDQTIVNIALPKVINDFGISISSAGWIATAYILANAVFVPVWGKLGDTIGRKKVYIFGFVMFIIGSVLAGLAWNLQSMIVFRIIQAIAGSADYPTAMAILTVTFAAGKQRAQALGIWSSVFAASAVIGPLIGGPIIDHFSWRWVFFINLPVGIIGLIMALVFVKESVSVKKSVSFDWLGAITLGGALTGLVLVLDKGPDWGWGSVSSLVCYALTLAFGLIFYYIEKHVQEPIVDLKFFKNSTFVNAQLNNFIIFVGLMGSMFSMPIFAQTFLGLNATQTGYLFIPMAGALMIAAPLGGSFSGKIQSRYIIAGSTFVAGIGIFLFSFLDPRSTAIDMMIPLAVMAFGMGFGMSQRTSVIATSVPASEIGVASSILALVRNIAGAFGIAIFATILNNSTNNAVMNIASRSSINLSPSQITPTILQEYTSLIILKAQVIGYDKIYIYATVLVLVGAALALFLKDSKPGEAGAIETEEEKTKRKEAEMMAEV